jgi:hypothetical protein
LAYWQGERYCVDTEKVQKTGQEKEGFQRILPETASEIAGSSLFLNWMHGYALR